MASSLPALDAQRRPKQDAYGPIGYAISGLTERADALASQFAGRGPEIEARLKPHRTEQGGRRLPTKHPQPLAPAPKLLPRPYTAGQDAMELAERSRYFATALVALGDSLPGMPGALPELQQRPRTGVSQQLQLKSEPRLGPNLALPKSRSTTRLPPRPSPFAAHPRGPAVSRLDALTNAFVDDFKRQHKLPPACLRVQAAWRMHAQRRRFLGAMRLRREAMRPLLEAWRDVVRAAGHARRGLQRAVLRAWRGEARQTLRLLSYLCHGLNRVDGRAEGASAGARAWHSFLVARERSGAPPADAQAIVASLRRCADVASAAELFAAWRSLAAAKWSRRRRAADRLRTTLRPVRIWPWRCSCSTCPS